jgi:hypothetical protein
MTKLSVCSITLKRPDRPQVINRIVIQIHKNLRWELKMVENDGHLISITDPKKKIHLHIDEAALDRL